MSKHGWVPVTPRGRALWDCADEKKMEAEYSAYVAGGFRPWNELKKKGWRVVRCYVGVDLGE